VDRRRPEGRAEAAESYAGERYGFMLGSGTLKRSLCLLHPHAITSGAVFTLVACRDGMFLAAMGSLTFVAPCVGAPMLEPVARPV
jgi:hypothetical protein